MSSLQSSSRRDGVSPADRAVRIRRWTYFLSRLGAMVVIVAVIIGLRMVLHGIRIECSTGTGRCFTHPRAGEGVTLIITSVLLGIAIALAAMLINLVLGRDRQR